MTEHLPDFRIHEPESPVYDPFYENTLTDAIELAAQIHDGQTDKGGTPYILHPLRVMLKMATDEERIVAVLHDVIEDSDGRVTLERLTSMGFSGEITEALDALTKRPGEAYGDYIQRLKAASALARKVKLADLEDNMDLARIAEPSAQDRERVEKYRAAYVELSEQAQTE